MLPEDSARSHSASLSVAEASDGLRADSIESRIVQVIFGSRDLGLGGLGSGAPYPRNKALVGPRKITEDLTISSRTEVNIVRYNRGDLYHVSLLT